MLVGRCLAEGKGKKTRSKEGEDSPPSSWWSSMADGRKKMELTPWSAGVSTINSGAAGD